MALAAVEADAVAVCGEQRAEAVRVAIVPGGQQLCVQVPHGLDGVVIELSGVHTPHPAAPDRSPLSALDADIACRSATVGCADTNRDASSCGEHARSAADADT